LVITTGLLAVITTGLLAVITTGLLAVITTGLHPRIALSNCYPAAATPYPITRKTQAKRRTDSKRRTYSLMM